MLVLDTHILYWWANQTADKLRKHHVEASGVMVIPVSRNIALRATQLPEHHKDPIDRLVIATALEHNARLISLDTRFPDYAELNALLVRL